MIDPSAQKRALRLRIIADILAMEPEDRRSQEAALVDLFPRLPGFREAGTVLLFASAFPEEYATTTIVQISSDLNKRTIFPRVDRREDRLRLFFVDDPSKDLVRGMMGIPEPRRGLTEFDPERVDWALVPGLGFDARGFRLGRGRGHYDRLLPTLRPEAGRWALALTPQWVEALPREPHDVPLDGIVGVDRIVARPGKAAEKVSDFG